MKLIGVGLCLIGIGMIALAGVETAKLINTNSRKIKTDGAHNNWEFDEY